MSLDLSKLQNVKKCPDGKVTARCPACAAAGGDDKGEHLVIYPNGKFGCAANPVDKGHRKEIFALTGKPADVHVPGKISVQTFKVADSHVLMDLGQFGRFSTEVIRKRVKPEPSPSVTRPMPSKPKPDVRPLDTPRYVKPPLDPDDPTLVGHDVAMARSGGVGTDPEGGATEEEIRAFIGMN